MKQSMRNWVKWSRRGVAVLLAAVMVIGFRIPAYATDYVTELTLTDAPAVETVAKTDASEPAVESSESDVGDDGLDVPETAPAVPEVATPMMEGTETVTDAAAQIQQSAYEQAMDEIASMAEEAKALEADEDTLDEYYERLRELYSNTFDLYDTDAITADQWDAFDAKFLEILTYLETTYGYVDGKIQTLETSYDLGGALQASNRSGIKINLFDYGALVANATDEYTPSFHFNYPSEENADSLYLDHPSGTESVPKDVLTNTLAERLLDAEGYPVVNINGSFKSLKNLFNDSLPYTTQKPYDERVILWVLLTTKTPCS